MTTPPTAREIATRETCAVQLRLTEALLDYLTRDDEATLAYNVLMDAVRDQMLEAIDAAVRAKLDDLDLVKDGVCLVCGLDENAVADAVRAERERCASVVASLAIPHPEVSVPPEYQTTAEIRNETLEEVAAALRAPEAGKETP